MIRRNRKQIVFELLLHLRNQALKLSQLLRKINTTYTDLNSMLSGLIEQELITKDDKYYSLTNKGYIHINNHI